MHDKWNIAAHVDQAMKTKDPHLFYGRNENQKKNTPSVPF